MGWPQLVMGELAVVVLVKSGEGGRGIRDLTGGEFAIVIGVQGSDEGGRGGRSGRSARVSVSSNVERSATTEVTATRERIARVIFGEIMSDEDTRSGRARSASGVSGLK